MPNDWRLRYAGTDLSFGSIASSMVFPVAPSVGSPDVETDDARRPRGDGVLFGADFVGGRTIDFEIDVVGDDEAETLSRVSALSRAWRADRIRQTPGALAELTSHNGRTAFGRPRRFAASDDSLPQGLSAVTADFVTADANWYGPEQASRVDFVPAAGGGLKAPLASPLSTTATSDRSTVFTVSGAANTWPVFEVVGPISNPVVEVVGRFRLTFRLSLAYDQRLVIDTRPWARTILRNGASVAGSLSRTSSRLSQASLPTGSHQLVLRGASAPGTAAVTVRWRDAYLTP